MSSIKSGESIDELFEEAAGILDEPDTSNNVTNASPRAGKTPTTNIAELATAVDGGSGYKCKDGIPSRGVHVNPPHSSHYLELLWFDGWESQLSKRV